MRVLGVEMGMRMESLLVVRHKAAKYGDEAIFM
jgi:hypothetical protein